MAILITGELVVVRPYGQVAEKGRAVWFGVVKVYVCLLKVIFNANLNVAMAYVMLLIVALIIAVIFTYFILVTQFYTFYKEFTDTRK